MFAYFPQKDEMRKRFHQNFLPRFESDNILANI